MLPALTALLTLTLVGVTALVPPQDDFSYRGSASGSETLTTTGDPAWDTRSVEARMRLNTGGTAASGLVLHYANSQSYYLFLYSFNSTALMIYKRDGGYSLLASVPFTAAVGEEHVMRAEGDDLGNLRLLWDGIERVSVTDTQYSSGEVGLRVWGQSVDFDDVLVEDSSGATLLFDDFEDGNASGWTAGTGWNVLGPGTGTMPVPQLETGFTGGNGLLTGTDLQSWTVWVTPELKGSSPYRSWFYFKLSNVSAAQPTTVVVQNSGWLVRPSYSYDNQSWQQFPPGAGGAFSMTFTSDPVWIAHTTPYLPAHLQQLIQDVQAPHAQASLLTTSEAGNAVPLLTLTDTNALQSKSAIWLVARQHAWEASGSWVADGLVRWVASDAPAARRLRRKTVVYVVPIMDVDNVLLGGSGKDQQPIDINRDWSATPNWLAVQSAISAIDASAQALPYGLFIDSHCPGPGGSPVLYVQPSSMVSPSYWARFLEFRQLLSSTAGGGAFPYVGAYSTAFGPGYHPLWYQMSFWHQFNAHPEARLSLTLETPISSTLGYTDLGAGLGAALDLFFACETPATSYCTAGTSAAGCQAALSACGTPSGTASGGFELHATQVEGGKDALFFLGSSGRQANPWGSGTSFQCVTPPVTRASLLTGRGTPEACDGAFFQDLNALWCPTCPKPAKNPGAGAVVQAQLWYRDPLNTSNQTTSLSDALEFLVGP